MHDILKLFHHTILALNLCEAVPLHDIEAYYGRFDA
jgi:hypothetical protein